MARAQTQTQTNPRIPHRGGKLGRLLAVLLVLGALALWINAEALRRWQYERWPTAQLVAQAQQQPQNAILAQVAGRRCLQQNAPERAQAFLDAALQAHPHDAQLSLLAGRVARLIGDPQRAGSLLNAALQAEPANPEMLYWTGELLIDRGRKTKAFSLWHDAVRLDPSRGDIWRRIGEIEIESQEFSSALQALDDAEKVTPTAAVARLRAAALSKLGRADEAETAARLAVQRQPNGVGYRLLGQIIQESGEPTRLREAQDDFKRALQDDPQDAATMKLLALNYRALGEHTQAVKVLRKNAARNASADRRLSVIEPIVSRVGRSRARRASVAHLPSIAAVAGKS